MPPLGLPLRREWVSQRGQIDPVALAAVEDRLGSWSRKLSLKVSIEDDIEEVANRYLRPNNVFSRAEGFSKIGIAVAYSKEGDARARTLNITIAGSKSCNLQSNKDPEERSFGYPKRM